MPCRCRLDELFMLPRLLFNFSLPWVLREAQIGGSTPLVIIFLLLLLVIKSHLTLCKPMNCDPPITSVHGNSQAKILEFVVISLLGDFPDPGLEPMSPAWQENSEPPGKP